MKGRGHLSTGAAVLLDAAALAALSYSEAAHPLLQQAGTALLSYMNPWQAMGGGIRGAVGCAAGCMLYFAGLLLPDLDNESSLACRMTHIYLRINHRGWTHSVWAVMLASLAACAYMPFLCLAAGMLVHDLMDAPSQAGWVPFYPLGRWRTVHGTVMRRGWTPGLYSSNRPGSEEAFGGAVVLLCAVAAGWAFYTGFWPKGAWT